MKPSPVVISQSCSLCGLDWSRHGNKPTALTCIDLLKADLAVKPIVLREPYPVVTYPIRPAYPSPHWYSGQLTTGTASHIRSINACSTAN